MAKLTKGGALELIESWAELQAKIAKAEERRNAEMAPLIERHNEELKPVIGRHDTRIAKLADEAEAIEQQVLTYLQEQGKDQVLATAKAIAQQKTEIKIGSRTIDPQKFIEAAKSRGQAMWDCISVGVAKAIKLLGEDEIDRIAEKKTTETVVRTLRLQ